MAMIEALETRTFLSVSAFAGLHHVGAAAPHLSVALTPGLTFQGSQMDSNGNVNATLSMLLTKSGVGYHAVVTVTNESGKVSKVTLNVNGAGYFSYSNNEGAKFRVQGQLSADKSSISGTYTQMNGKVTTTGTISLSAVTTNSNTPSNTTSGTTTGGTSGGGSNSDGTTKASVATFTGLATDSNTGTTNNVSITLTATSAGATGVLEVVNGNGSTSSYPFAFNADHTFSFTTTGDGKTVHASGMLNSNSTITGNYAASGSGGGSSSGTLSLTMNTAQGSGGGGTTTSTTDGGGSNTTTKTSVANYTGLAIDAVTKTTNNLTLTITATPAKIGAVLNVTNGDGGTTSYPFTINSDHTFNFDSTQNGKSVHIAGTVSADGKTITGTYSAGTADIVNSHGTFSLTRN